MKKTVKCYRCGKEYDLDPRKVKEIISCSHCHQQMKFTKKTATRFQIVRYLFVLSVCVVIAFGMNMVSKDNYLILLGTLAVAMGVSLYSDQLCLNLTGLIFGLEYEEYHEEKKTKKEIRKERSKPKKGLFQKKED